MAKYGLAALRATELIRGSRCLAAPEAWVVATKEIFPGQPASQSKGCPRGAFLGLCESGFVVGVPVGRYTNAHLNKKYAIAAVQLLAVDSKLAARGEDELWQRVMNGRTKRANSQMDVVLTLWTNGLIARTG
jgi:hypothetical protein